MGPLPQSGFLDLSNTEVTKNGDLVTFITTSLRLAVDSPLSVDPAPPKA